MLLRNRRSLLAALAVMTALISACGGTGAGDTATTEAEDTATEGAFDAESYFEGRTIRIAIVQSVGGGTDLVTRFIASHWPRFIPGEPGIAVTNTEFMGGTNLVYESPSDSIVIGATSKAQNFYVGADEDEANFDPLDFQLIGAMEPDARVIILHGDLGYSNLGEVAGVDDPPLRIAGAVAGPQDVVDDNFLWPWLCVNLEASCEFIQVDDDSSSIVNLMMERGEINVTSGGLVSRVNSLGEAFSSGRFVMGALFEVGPEGPTAELPEGVELPPTVSELLPAESQEEWASIQPIVGNGGLQATLYAGPNLPGEVVEVLQQALVDMANDEEIKELFQEQLSTPFALIPGPEAEDVLAQSTQIYQDNVSSYRDLQERFWSDYWK